MDSKHASTEWGRNFEIAFRASQNDINFFVRKLFNFTPTWQQQELLDLVQLESTLPIEQRKRRIAVKSGQGPGKSCCSTLIACWRAFRAYGAMTIVTAPTMRQVKDVFIAELRRRIDNAHPYIQEWFKVDNTQMTIMGVPKWGISTVTACKPENAQGLHEPNLTIICEEASGIDRDIQEQFQGTRTNLNSLWLQIGNPNKRDTYFFDCFNKNTDKWHTLTWNAEESPIVDKQKIKEDIDEYGRDSDYYRVRVLGEFPHMNPNSIMSSEDLFACQKNDTFECMQAGGFKKSIGIDVSRYGSDESVIVRRVGNAVLDIERFAKTEPARVIERAFAMQEDNLWTDDETTYIFDADGMGQGLAHRFHDAGKKVIEFHNGATAIKSRTFANKATEAYWHVGRIAKARGLYLPKDNILVQQLSTREYTVENTTKSKGRIVVESKKDYCKRGPFDSPDRADALVMAFYDPDVLGGRVKMAFGQVPDEARPAHDRRTARAVEPQTHEKRVHFWLG